MDLTERLLIAGRIHVGPWNVVEFRADHRCNALTRTAKLGFCCCFDQRLNRLNRSTGSVPFRTRIVLNALQALTTPSKITGLSRLSVSSAALPSEREAE